MCTFMASEKQFETKVKKYLKDNGCYEVKFFANAYTKTGVPDVLACVRGFFFGIELKAPNGRPTPIQIYNLEQIHKAGGFGILLYPKDYNIFTDLIQGIIFSKEDVLEDYEYFRKELERWKLRKEL